MRTGLALCALACVSCESSPAARTMGVKTTPAFNRDSIYRAYAHDQDLVHRAFAIADSDARSVAAYGDFLGTLDSGYRAWWDEWRAHKDPPIGLPWDDSTMARAFRRYDSTWRLIYASAIDSEVWAEHPRKWWVMIAVTQAPDFPPVGRLYRLADRRWHDVIVLRRDELTSDRILAALRFTRANWLAQGLSPASSSVVDIGLVSDTAIRAGVGPMTATWVIDQLADTHGASVDVDWLGILPATSVYLPLPRAVQLKGPA